MIHTIIRNLVKKMNYIKKQSRGTSVSRDFHRPHVSMGHEFFLLDFSFSAPKKSTAKGLLKSISNKNK